MVFTILLHVLIHKTWAKIRFQAVAKTYFRLEAFAQNVRLYFSPR